MHACRATSAFLALVLMCAGAGALAAPALAAGIAAPAKLRQGDPLLAWIILREGASVSAARPLEARLENAAGKVVASAVCFAAAGTAAAGTELETAKGLYGALMALSPNLPPGPYRLVAGGAAASLAVEARIFPLETIKLDQANADIRTLPSKRKDEEARRLWALLLKVDPAAVYAGAGSFMFPSPGGWRSAGYGDARLYEYPSGGVEKSVHAGIDWAVVTGTEVRACARGRVVMAADREVTGKTLVIEHLPGLYSLYFHLSAIEVAEGALVERAALVARSGSSGMSTGPHLHWELRAKGDAVDPEYWLGSALLDKSAVTAIMHGLIEGR